MAVQNLGRVGLVLKGDWSSSTAYVPLDVVSYDGNSWVAKRNNTNVEPNTTNTSDWQLISNNSSLISTVQGYKNDAAASASAAAASAGLVVSAVAPVESTSTASKTYPSGDFFIYDGSLYIATASIAQGATITPDTNCEDIPGGISVYVAQLNGDVADLKAAIAPIYTALTFPVSKGQPCWYEGILYKAKQDITTSESWTAAHWEMTVLGEDLADVVRQMTDIAPFFSASAVYEAGDLVWYNGRLYRADQSHTGAWNAYHFTAACLNDGIKATIGGNNAICLRGAEKIGNNRFVGERVGDALADHIGETISVSFDLKASAARSIKVYAYQSTGYSIEDTAYFTPSTTEYTRFSFVTKAKNYGEESGYNHNGMVGFYDETDANTIYVKNFKIELGSIATPWAMSAQDAFEQATDLKSAIDQLPSIKESTAEDVDIDISDPNGNVIARFSDGGIQVKNFDSGDVGDLSDLTTTAKGTLVEAINEAAESGGSQESPVQVSTQSTDTSADFYISDQNGHGLVRFDNGNIQTKRFNSDQAEYRQTFSYTNESGAKYLAHFFPKGTMLAFHLVIDGVKGSGSIANSRVTYGYTDTNGTDHALGQEFGYNYLKAVLPADAEAVYVSYGTGLNWGDDATLAFSVFSEASFSRQPKIITVSADGTKDYTTLRAAVDAVTPYASEYTPYEIHVYPGTYNVLTNYTSEEIATAGFKGLFLYDGMSIIGEGNRTEIIVAAEMSTTDYTSEKRNDVSTINVQGNIRIENVTVNATNIRYCIHDDTSSMQHKKNTRIIKNVKLQGFNLTTSFITYGAGGGNGKSIYCEDCDFTDTFHVHNSANNQRPYFVTLNNCMARAFTFSDYANVGTATRVVLNNCKAEYIKIDAASSGQTQTLFIDGVGTSGAMVSVPAGYVYSLGDCHRLMSAQITAGKAVKLGNTVSRIPAVATLLDDVYGVSVGVESNCTIVQTSGYINSNTLGLTGLSVGDYLTIDTTTGSVVDGGTAANAIAKVKYIDSDGVAYAKMML